MDMALLNGKSETFLFFCRLPLVKIYLKQAVFGRKISFSINKKNFFKKGVDKQDIICYNNVAITKLV